MIGTNRKPFRTSGAMPWLGAGAQGMVLVALAIGTWLAWPALIGQPTGTDLLFAAAATDDAAGVQRALNAGASANADGGRALRLAANGGDVVTVRLLLSRGANPSAEWGGYTPLMSASTGGNVEVIQLLIDAGADPNQADAGLTPLGIAALCGHERAVVLLLARGASATGRVAGAAASRHPPLVAAAGSGSAPPSLLQRLIDAGADINAPDDEGTSPLMAATAIGRSDLVQLLIQLGARTQGLTPRASAPSIPRSSESTTVAPHGSSHVELGPGEGKGNMP